MVSGQEKKMYGDRYDRHRRLQHRWGLLGHTEHAILRNHVRAGPAGFPPSTPAFSLSWSSWTVVQCSNTEQKVFELTFRREIPQNTKPHDGFDPVANR